MKYKAVLTLLLCDLNYIFLNGFHMFAHQLLRLVPVSGNNGFHQPSVLLIHLQSGIMFLHNIGSGAGNDLLSQLSQLTLSHLMLSRHEAFRMLP